MLILVIQTLNATFDCNSNLVGQKLEATKINTYLKVERTGDKGDRIGDDVAGSIDFVAGSFDFLHIHQHMLI